MPKITLEHVERMFSPALKGVLKRYLYIDTLSIVMSHSLSDDDKSRLRELGVSAVVYYTAKSRWSGFPYGIRLQRPTREQISFIREVSADYRISRLDGSLDLITRDRATADAVGKIVDKHLVQTHRGKRKKSTIGSTKYGSFKRNTTRNSALYSDRPSKITGEPCCHLEFRTMTSRMCSNYGMGSLANFDVIDLAALGRKHGKLAVFDRRKLNQHLNQIAAYRNGRLKACGRQEARRRADYITAMELGADLPGFEETPNGRTRYVSVQDRLDEISMQDWLDAQQNYPFWKPIFRQSVTYFPVDILFEGAERAYPTLI